MWRRTNLPLHLQRNRREPKLIYLRRLLRGLADWQRQWIDYETALRAWSPGSPYWSETYEAARIVRAFDRLIWDVEQHYASLVDSET